MVYIFDPTTCEEPTKPTYKYSPIPKVVECSCCPNPADYEENATGNTDTNTTPNTDKSIEGRFDFDTNDATWNTLIFTLYEGSGELSTGYIIDNQGERHELTFVNKEAKLTLPYLKQHDFVPFSLYTYGDVGTKLIATLEPTSMVQR